MSALYLYGGNIVKKTEPKTQPLPFTHSNRTVPHTRVNYVSSFYVFIYRELVRQMDAGEYINWPTFKRYVMANYEIRNGTARMGFGPAKIIPFKFKILNAFISLRWAKDEYESVEPDQGDHYYVCRIALAVVHGKY